MSITNPQPKDVIRTDFWSRCYDASIAVGSHRITKLTGLKVIRPTIRSSGMSMANQCLRKYLYRYRLGLKPRGYDSALTIGKMFHEIRAHLTLGKDEGDAIAPVIDTVSELQDSLRELANPNTCLLPWGQDVNKTIDTINKDFAMARALALWSHQLSREADTTKYEIVGVEKLVEIRYKNLVAPIRVRIDLLLRDKKTKELWILDYKTTSKPARLMAESLSFAIQPRLYRLGIHCWLQQDPEAPKGTLVGTIHDILQKPAIRLRQGDTFEDYLDRINDLYDKDHQAAIAGKNPNPMFVRVKTRYHAPVMDSELMIHLKQANAQATCRVSLDQYPRHPDPIIGCYTFNKPCPYMALCTTHPHRWRDEVLPNFDVQSRDADDLAGSFT